MVKDNHLTIIDENGEEVYVKSYLHMSQKNLTKIMFYSILLAARRKRKLKF